MKADTTFQDTDLSSIPMEFKENYLFLCELINCRGKNSSATEGLCGLASADLSRMRPKLNQRQKKMLRGFLQGLKERDTELLDPPVPDELEASIRIKKRSGWLPWEAEAIRKIELWRKDATLISDLTLRYAEHHQSGGRLLHLSKAKP